MNKILDYVDAVNFYKKQVTELSREWRKTDFQDPEIHRAIDDNQNQYEYYCMELEAALLEWVREQLPKELQSDYNAISAKAYELAELLSECSKILQSCAADWEDDGST